MRLPDGFDLGVTRDATFIARDGLADFAREAIEADGSLYAFAVAHAVRTMPGRDAAPVCVIDSPAGRLVVRHYRRGGGVRALGDRYLRIGTPRPFHELVASQQARARGIPTPAVAIAAVREAGAFYRGDIATDWIPESTTLADITFGDSAVRVEDELAAWRAAGRLVRQAARAGVAHADLNARNVLIEWTADGPSPHLLDLDRCTVFDTPDPGAFDRMEARLRRSAHKLEQESGHPADGALAAFDEGARG